MTNRIISTSSEWTFELIEKYEHEIARVAADYQLDTYPNQLEIISSEQMMDAYSSVGMPVGYNHWSYGKRFISTEQNYRHGMMGLAYEIVINSNPCIAYLMEENTLTMQALVIAHAAFGHNSFFKGNYLFRNWTNADAIIDYLVFARDFIADCEQRYGEQEVEQTLDSCHALMNYGVDSCKRPYALSAEEERVKQQEREEYLQSQVNHLWRTLPDQRENDRRTEACVFPSEPQENLLYFIEKNAPFLEPWKREIVRITRKIAQYFYPQRQTQVMNEGWACFWHYTILNTLYDQGYVSDGFMIEFLQSHTSVTFQPDFDDPRYNGINPYTLGFSMMRDIQRICQEPTEEDRDWFPELAGSDWIKSMDFAMRNFKDESFIAQYLSPKLIRDLKLFTVLDDDKRDTLEVTAIHDEAGYRYIRSNMAKQYRLSDLQPDIQVYRADRRGDRSLTLRHIKKDRRTLFESADEALKHVANFWGFNVRLEEVNENGSVDNLREVIVNAA